MGYLDNAGLAHLWGKVAEALSGKQDTLAPGDGVSLTGPSISVKIPVHEPVTWSEYNALTLEQKTNGLYFILSDLEESGPEIDGGPEESLPGPEEGPEESLPEPGEGQPEPGEGETVPDEVIPDEGGLDEVAPWEVSALRLNGVEILLPYASTEYVDTAIVTAIQTAIPKGGIIIWSGASNAIPTGWALCDGTQGTPDLRDRFVLGAGTKYRVGNKGGEETHALTVAEMPSHNHTISTPDLDWDRENLTGGGYVDSVTIISGDLVTGKTGGGQAHNNMPPYYTLCYIMRL